MDETLARIRKHRQLQIEADNCPCLVLLRNQLTAKDKRESAKIQRAEDDLLWSFVDRPPTTVAGAAALLRYAAQWYAEGHECDNRSYYDDGEDLPWLVAVVKAVGSTLEEAATT
jgi:hypothetical protein